MIHFFLTDVATTCGYGQDQSHRKVITFQALWGKIPHQIKSLYPIEEMEGVFPYTSLKCVSRINCLFSTAAVRNNLSCFCGSHSQKEKFSTIANSISNA